MDAAVQAPEKLLWVHRQQLARVVACSLRWPRQQSSGCKSGASVRSAVGVHYTVHRLCGSVWLAGNADSRISRRTASGFTKVHGPLVSRGRQGRCQSGALRKGQRHWLTKHYIIILVSLTLELCQRGTHSARLPFHSVAFWPKQPRGPSLPRPDERNWCWCWCWGWQW